MLTKSYKVCRVAKLDVYLDLSLAILVAILVFGLNSLMLKMCPNSSPYAVFAGSVVLSLLFVVSIFAHEMGHAFVGRRVGIRFSRITLMIFGGAASMDNFPPTPKSEFITSIAGPITSIIVAMISIIVGFVLLAFGASGDSVPFTVCSNLASVNIVLGIFNLVPAFPLDGGRLLRSAIWWIKKDVVEATRIASFGSKGFLAFTIVCGALMSFGVRIPYLGVGLGSGIWISFIGWLIYIMSKQELALVQKRIRR